jgi:protein-disulfide isomerase
VTRKTAILLLLAVALLAASFFGGMRYGEKQGQRAGYQWGLKKGRVDAARLGPPEVRNVGVGLDILQQTPAWQSLPPSWALGANEGGSEEAATEGRASELVTLVNAAPSPCRAEARRGISLASALLGGDGDCAGLADQLWLAAAAIDSVGPEEALAVLRVERRVQPDVTGRPALGPENAPVVLTEWADFECPYCVRSQATIHEILEARSDVRVVFKHLPLSFHKAAMPAALAAEAAAEQGLFWPMHDALFAMGKSLRSGIPSAIDSDAGPVAFEEQALAVGLDLERYRSDYRSERVYQRVRGDAAEARRLGVNGTPSFFLDGRRVQERLNGRTIDLLVEKALAERAGRFSWDLKAPQGVPSAAERKADQ